MPQEIPNSNKERANEDKYMQMSARNYFYEVFETSALRNNSFLGTTVLEYLFDSFVLNEDVQEFKASFDRSDGVPSIKPIRCRSLTNLALLHATYFIMIKKLSG